MSFNKYFLTLFLQLSYDAPFFHIIEHFNIAQNACIKIYLQALATIVNSIALYLKCIGYKMYISSHTDTKHNVHILAT